MPPVTVGALLGLAIGLGVGALLHGSAPARVDAVLAWITPLGRLWINLLRMTVVPLLVSQLVVAVAHVAAAKSIGRLGGLSFALFVGFLLLGAVFTLAVAPALLAGYDVDARSLSAFGEAQAPGPTGTAPSENVLEWVVALVPENVVKAASGDALLPLIVFALLFGLALRGVPAERRSLVVGFFQGIGEAMFVLVRWILWLTPIGVFALACTMAARTGLATAGVLGTWVLLVSGLLLGFTLCLYPLTALLGRIGLRRFAYGVAPAQAVAVGTRSSLAALPALLEGAQARLNLPPRVAGFVLPLAVSTFKVNRTVSSTAKLLFLATVYGIDLSVAEIAAFVATIMVLSFATPGLPSTGTMRSLPAYLALGIPLEGCLILDTVEAIPDVFKTLANVTADMSVAVVVDRHAGPK